MEVPKSTTPTNKGDTMATYYVNKNEQSNGDHEVHKDGCLHGAERHNRLYLGEHAACQTAVAQAKRTYPTANGCYYCSPACNTG